MTDRSSNQSARIMGGEHGLTATEMNFLLKEEGFLDGEPNAWIVTEKGRQFANGQSFHRGTGGYAQFNKYWDQLSWDPSVMEDIDISDDRKAQIKQATREARRLKADIRSAEQADYDDGRNVDAIAEDDGIDPLTVAVGIALTAISIYGIKKIAPHLKALWADTSAKTRQRLANRKSNDTEDAERPENDDRDQI